MMPPPRIKFEGIEVGRAVAAILVVMHHAGNNIAEHRFYDTVIFGGHLGNFNVGVDFFFVLSGFIIAWVHWDDIGRPDRLKRYALRRFLRIYPPYWAILIPLAALYFAAPGAGKTSQHDPGVFFCSLALVPCPHPPIIGAAWTLVHEILFYAVFGVIIALGRRAIWLFPLWAVTIIGAPLAQPLVFPLATLFAAFNLEFLIGICAALYLRTHTVPFPHVLAVVGILAFLTLMIFATSIQDVQLFGRLAFGLSATIAILGLVELERGGRFRLPQPLLFFGSASYAIYLIHGFVLSMTIQATTRLIPHVVPLWIVFIILCGFAIAAGCLFHAFVERPLTRALKRRVQPERRDLVTPGARTAGSV